MNPDKNSYKWPNMTHPAHSTEFAKLGLKKLLYMGPWFHIEPTLHAEFKNVNEFIYVDLQPRGENDKLPYRETDYKHNFINELTKKCYYFGYDLMDDYPIDDEYVYALLKGEQQHNWENKFPYINPHVFIFKNKYTHQTLKYYISTNFLYNMNPELRNDICSADGLILSGYFPNKELLRYFTGPKTIIGFTETYFPHESELEDKVYTESIIPALFDDTNGNLSSRVNQYYLMSIHTTHMIKCKSMHDMYIKSEYEYDLKIQDNYDDCGCVDFPM